jgi:hypothetical protein
MYFSPFCKSQTEVGMKHPCLAQQEATTPVASRLCLLSELAAVTARCFLQEGLWGKKVSLNIRRRLLDVQNPVPLQNSDNLYTSMTQPYNPDHLKAICQDRVFSS